MRKIKVSGPGPWTRAGRGRMPRSGASSTEPALDAVVQRARAREVRQQILHLIREHTPALEEDVLRVSRGERHGDELHLRLLRRARGLLVIAAAACSHDIGPDVEAALAERPDVVARELA